LARTRLALGEQFADRVLAAGAQAIQNRKSYEPPDWSLIGVSDRRRTRQVEVYVEGDFNWNSGSMRGSQVGGRENQNKLRYKEIRAAVDAPQTVAELREALGELASEVGSADLDFREKAAALTALGWWQDNIDVPVEPDDAREYASVLHRAGGWIWGRFAGLINDMPAALVAAWVFEVVKHFAVG